MKTEECCAVMLLKMVYVISLLIVYFIHETEYCTVIGPHSPERWEECQYDKSPGHFPLSRSGTVRETMQITA